MPLTKKKKFTNLCDKTNICKYSLKIPRIKMPQFDKNTTNEFIKYLKKNNIIVKKKYINVLDLKPTQNQLNLEKIENMKKNIYNLNTKTIIVSKNNYIIDGHHRWGTLVSCLQDRKCINNSKSKNKISTYKINLLPLKIIQLSKKFDVKYNNIHTF